MNDQTAQDQQVPAVPPAQPSSYVDDYTPPASPTSNSKLEDISLDTPITKPASDSTTDVSANTNNSDITEDIKAPEVAPVIAQDDDLSSEEDIEAQNIFVMLGVEAGDDNLKEKFLDQLQDVIWDDFLGNDVELLLSEEEMDEFKVYKGKADSATGDAQEKAKDEMVEFLEKLVPDLEDVMLEKALDLKADLFTERISGMKEYYSDKSEQLASVDKAESMMFEDNWKSAAETLNNIKE